MSPRPVRPELTIALTRRRDGDTLFRLTRADGSAIWQRTRGATGAFFPPHDLTHYAVETLLGHTRGFYGLVTDGWNLEDFAAPWPRGRLVDVDPSELIVGFLDRTDLDHTALDQTGRPDGTSADAAALNTAAAIFFTAARTNVASAARWRDLTDAALAAVRARARDLVAAWRALPAGETLTLAFDRRAATPATHDRRA